MIRALLSGAVLIGLAGCSKPWESSLGESVMLTNVSIVTGKHCESSAMLNMLRYLGYPVTENLIAGGGAAMAFFYQKSGFPFLGARSITMRNDFLDSAGIAWKTVTNPGPEESWSGVVNVLKRGIPVVFRVDMRYLPYLYGGKYGPSYLSFGWHLITLFGIDFKNETAYVSDTEYPGLQEIKLKDLDRARSSGTKVFPPMREYYWAEKMPAGFRIDWKKLTRNAIDRVIENYGPVPAADGKLADTGLAGLKNLGNNITNIEKDVPGAFLLPVVFDNFRGYIVEYGTDGAAFRIFFRDFLSRASSELNDRGLLALTPLLDDCIRQWKLLAAEFESISKTVKTIKDPEKRKELYRKAALTADGLYQSEFAFYQALKKYRDGTR